MFIKAEGINLIEKNNNNYGTLPEWFKNKLHSGYVSSINTEYPNWKATLENNAPLPKSWRVNVVGLGDVGSTLITGLRLVGGEVISSIGIFDLDNNKVLRNLYENNQILSPFSNSYYPQIVKLTEDNLFDCDMFVFCVTGGVPPLGSEAFDVRIAQYEVNSKIVSLYAKKARKHKYKGIFAVVSDPVDLLCKVALISSNTDSSNGYDYKGLLPEQIRGYGLGVMNARAAYFASENSIALHYEKEGRAFGPHGEGLIIADSIDNYNNELSIYLTNEAMNANLKVRATGFKPYIAPALSSGALSIIDTILGNWHYSSTYMGKVFIGAKNRLRTTGIEIEQIDINPLLRSRLNSTYERLCDYK
jgi:hypothetical protein